LGRIEAGAASGLIAVPGAAATAERLVDEWIAGGAPRFITEEANDATT